MKPRTKIEQLREYMAAEDWRSAMRMASKFPRLGTIRGAVLDAQMAFTNPRFAEQIGKNPQVLIEAGRAALVAQYAPRGD